MAWKWVSKIKNGNNEYNFVVPLVSISSYTMGNSSYDQISNTAYRSNAAQFTLVSAMLNDANTQKTNDPTIYNSHTDGSIDKFVYGDSGGTALRLVNTRSASGDTEQNSFKPYRYLSFLSNNQIANSSVSLDISAKAEGNFCGFALVMNEDTEQIYVATVDGQIYYYRADHTPNSSDYVYFRIRIFHNNRSTTDDSNLWDVFKNSIPSGGGGSDPYADGGYSTGTDTGTGTFDDSSESVSLPTTYAYSATAAGLISQYVVTEAELRTFGAWLWYGGSIIDDLKHFFQSPMEAIFSVGMLPFTPSDTTNYNIYVGSLDANTTGALVNDTVEKISMGSITFDGYYGSALDFNPYTKIEIFLPYCGNFSLNPDEVMGHTISVDYYCDSVSGDCVAFVSDEDRVLYQVKGNCFVQIPLAARDFTAQYASAIGAVGTVAAGLAASVASGGMSAPIAVGMGTSMASNAMNAKTHIARAGGVSGMAGFMSIQNPYVIITIPNQCLPEFQAEHQGYPLFVTKALKEFSGFTKVYEIHLDGLDCTDAEAKEIYDLLKGGVIL